MTGKREDCLATLTPAGQEPDDFARTTCDAFESRSKRDLEARARELRALDRNDSLSGWTTEDNSLNNARELELVVKAAGPVAHDDLGALGVLDEVGLEEQAALDEIAGRVGRALFDSGWTAESSRYMAGLTRGIGETLRYNLGRIRSHMPRALEALTKREARRETRPPVHRLALRSAGWQAGDAGDFIKVLGAKRAEVRRQALGGKWRLVLTDWGSTGRPVRMRLLDNIGMLFSRRDDALSAADSWLVLDEGQGGGDAITEQEAGIMTATGPAEDIVNRANTEARYTMGRMADSFKWQQRAIDGGRRMVPARADASGRMRGQGREIVVRTGPTGIRGHEGEGVDASTGRRQVVFGVTDLVRRSVGLSPRAAPPMVERAAGQAVAIQGAYASLSFNDPGAELQPLVVGRGMRQGPSGGYYIVLPDGTCPGLAAELGTQPGADGVKPCSRTAAISHTRGGSTIGLFGQTVTAQVQADQRGMKGNVR